MACTNLHLIDFSEEDDNLISVPFRDSLEDLRISLTFDNANTHLRPESLKPRRLSFLRKSLDWDTAFFTTEGLLNSEELCKVNKGFKKAESKQPSSGTRKDVQTRRVSKGKSGGDPNSRSANPQGSKGMPKTRIKDQKIAYSTEKNSYRLDGLSSSAASSKCAGRRINPRNTKRTTSPKSVLSPVSSTRSSSTSPDRRFNNAISTSDFQSPLKDVCQNLKEGKSTSSQYVTRSSIRNIKSSGLKMPSPRIGFFDEQPLQPLNLSPVSTENHPKVRKVSASCTKPKTDGEIHKGRSSNRLNIERKVQKNDKIKSIQKIGIKEKRDESDHQWSFQKSRKENKQCSFEDQVNGLDRQLEVLNLDSNVTDVDRGQQSCSRPDQLSIPSASEHTTTPCSRTPLAEKMLLTSDNVNKCDCIELFKGANSHVQSESVEPRRLSFCRKSLEWDSAFFSNAGLLNAEELCLVNRGFKAVEPDQPSSRTTKHIRRHTVAGWNQTSLDGNGFHGETLKGNVFKDVNPDGQPSSVTKTNPEQSQKPHHKARLKLMTQRFKRST